jgi:hypothetical protein
MVSTLMCVVTDTEGFTQPALLMWHHSAYVSSSMTWLAGSCCCCVWHILREGNCVPEASYVHRGVCLDLQCGNMLLAMWDSTCRWPATHHHMLSANRPCCPSIVTYAGAAHHTVIGDSCLGMVLCVLIVAAGRLSVHDATRTLRLGGALVAQHCGNG